jgi:hypothetical protein
MRWGGHVPLMGAKRNVCRILVGKPKEKRPLGRPTRRWEENIKIDLRKMGCCMWAGFIWFTIGINGWLL